MSSGGMEEEDIVFKKLDEAMNKHLKPLFVLAKVNKMGVKKVLVDGRVAVNMMLHFLLKKIGKMDIDLRPYNKVFSDYEGKPTKDLRVILVNIVVGIVVRPTLFMAIPSTTNYNLLLGQEWIYGVGEVPLTLHQRISIWRPNGILENVETYKSYFLAKLDHVNKGTFNKKITTIAPYIFDGKESFVRGDVLYSIQLDPTH